MIEVKTNKEIMKIKNTMFYGFSGKQFFLLICGFICGVLIFLLLPFHIIIRLLFMNVTVAAFVFSGIYSINNLSPGKLLAEMINTMKMRTEPLIMDDKRRGK